MWWDDDSIEQIVTREFVCNRLLPEEIERLDRQLGFGENLTDGTYWEWIEQKAKKVFLILTDLGLPDQIFGLIDDSWDDEDLPIALDQVERLALTPYKDAKIEKKFYHRQFHYLLRHLQNGAHLDYHDDELVPLDVAEKKHAANHNPHVDKVMLPREPGMVFCRYQIPLGPGSLSRDQFIREVNGIRHLRNDHLLSYWASYTHREAGYVLFTPASEFSLKSLLSSTPGCLKNLEKNARRQTVMNWIHCLADTVSFLHSQGLSHGNIRPSTVLFSNDHRVFFGGFTRFHTLISTGMTDSSSFDKEAYDYAAPEHGDRRLPSSPSFPPRAADGGGGAVSMTFAADIFSLGCVILELLSFLFKKHGRPFATHRAAKHKSAGRGGAVLDCSFQRNLGQVETWIEQLTKDASKEDSPVFRGVAPMLQLVKQMLAPNPADRPSAGQVQARMYQILTEACGIAEPHCVHNYGSPELDMASLTLGSSPLSPPPPGSPPQGSPLQASPGSPGAAFLRRWRSGSLAGDRRRRDSGGNSSSSGGGIRKMGTSAQEVENERETRRTRKDSSAGGLGIPEILARDESKSWHLPLYASR
ncbi:b7c0400b-c531-43ab-919a-5adb56738e25 [Thermothielavioides terrestris]|uniref:B7c0400b-c531-43ab-919a-5adb56738e25 n=1 Tax=Thermothielavioides terrestris TaxID=2587410 RepID=A0A446BYC2_9PEZI|nr:b7c0400b-c531-43ab-919a-5adb56738e25 [Thermothielavioides terrestris]